MQINYITGDAAWPDKTCPGDKIICHVCNDIGAWGRGFVLSLSNRWWMIRNVYLYDMKKELGEVYFWHAKKNKNNNIWVCNMIAQKGIRSKLNPIPLQYNYLTMCLLRVKGFILKYNMQNKPEKISLHMPRIGSGLAGGFWDDIESIIINIFDGLDLDIYVYDLKKKNK